MTKTKQLTTVRVSAEIVFTVDEDRVPSRWKSLNEGSREEKIRGLVTDIWTDFDLGSPQEGWEIDEDYVKDILRDDDFTWDEDAEEFNNYN